MLAAWVVTMGVMINRAYSRRRRSTSPPTSRATAPPRSGAASTTAARRSASPSARCRSPTTGFELQEDGRLQFSLLGARDAGDSQDHRAGRSQLRAAIVRRSRSTPAPARWRSPAASTGLRLSLNISSGGGTRTETRDLKEPPALMLSVGRRLASEGLVAGATRQWTVFDPGDDAERGGHDQDRQSRGGDLRGRGGRSRPSGSRCRTRISPARRG